MSKENNNQPAEADEEVVTAFKGFDKNLQCRGYQFEVGKTYEHQGKVEACKSGFHACEFPLDVFNYYAPSDSRFAVVKASGQLSRSSDDSKIASASITVEAEISLPVFVSRAVEWVIGKLDGGAIEQTIVTGHRSAATNTGYRSVATNTGYRSAATNTGDQSAATNTGYRSAATNTGYRSVATNTGDQSAATNTGDRSVATNTGDQSAATNTGYRSAAEVNATDSIAASLGVYGRARASAGSAIVLCYRDEEGRLIHIRASKVGDNGIKPDVWYSLGESGEFIEIVE